MTPLVLAGTAQITLLTYYAASHWIPLRGFNDLRFENRQANFYIQLFMAVLAVSTLLGHRFELWVAAGWYAVWMNGHLMSWWIPYLTGHPKAAIAVNKQRAYTFLPRIRDRVAPDLLHTIMGVLSVVTLLATWRAALS
ncbi:hypothetical protein [Phytomonospora endophytica]|uniref:Uncharacterized protein n=1 Tax=Phytomonospora endophytica TaxID=714109 RepID=A0A841FN35_9ACTN|nr:hypothetical protein [Phytomonospora endophytica]MBB6036313.1 hypothetical protein [Phytomonospora endophytica]GIG67220.1 hypothetical protein Pen01_35150 [Phytomonospora endophytica]